MKRSFLASTRTKAVSFVALLLAAGCSAGSGFSGAPVQGARSPSLQMPTAEISTVPAALQHEIRPALHPLARGAGWLSPAAKSCKNKLYVSSYRLGYVAIYCRKGQNQAPIGEITNGIETPEGANTDSKGNLYVSNTNASTVTEYARGSLAPSFTYSSGLTYPAGVAVDSKQNVYVTSLSPASVEVFPQGVNSPTLTITSITYPIDVAIDPSGNAYVTTYTANFSNGEIIKYSPGSSQGTNLGIVTDGPGGIALDEAGDIVTADQRLPGVLVFPPGTTSPSQTFAQNTLDPDPVRFARREHQVYVGDSIGNAVYVYDYPSGTLVDTITDGIDGPNGLALDPAAPL
jgi:sugar lactone lactonase YvrE